ncbi:Uncharacterised protein (plasmid) [Legionella adelaidensis]|uniref:Uncharacterized protein n=1 Tax=Legionella adelaidensis TaxID=45056 RepID=A0A0W0R4P5_9GAMM|nr:hypothetical protein [Legionella adelaidensis]KTC66047.1 hypothetical protein Lade_0705 [Legionella adelaidensis]VEH85735.1 Uncharacterised protein [Legionella adelaidensis]
MDPIPTSKAVKNPVVRERRRVLPSEVQVILKEKLSQNPYPDAATYKAWSTELTQKYGFDITVRKLYKFAENIRRREMQIAIPDPFKTRGRPSQRRLEERSSHFSKRHSPQLFCEPPEGCTAAAAAPVPGISGISGISGTRKVTVARGRPLSKEVQQFLNAQFKKNPYPDAATCQSLLTELKEKYDSVISVKRLKKYADNFRMNRNQAEQVEIPQELKKGGRPSLALLKARAAHFSRVGKDDSAAAAAPVQSQEAPIVVTVTTSRKHARQVTDAVTTTGFEEENPHRSAFKRVEVQKPQQPDLRQAAYYVTAPRVGQNPYSLFSTSRTASGPVVMPQDLSEEFNAVDLKQ